MDSCFRIRSWIFVGKEYSDRFALPKNMDKFPKTLKMLLKTDFFPRYKILLR